MLAAFILALGLSALGLTILRSTKSAATDGAIEGIHDLVSTVSSPLSSFVDSLNASVEEAQTIISSTDGWLGELEDGMLLRLEVFDSAHR